MVIDYDGASITEYEDIITDLPVNGSDGWCACAGRVWQGEATPITRRRAHEYGETAPGIPDAHS